MFVLSRRRRCPRVDCTHLTFEHMRERHLRSSFLPTDLAHDADLKLGGRFSHEILHCPQCAHPQRRIARVDQLYQPLHQALVKEHLEYDEQPTLEPRQERTIRKGENSVTRLHTDESAADVTRLSSSAFLTMLNTLIPCFYSAAYALPARTQTPSWLFPLAHGRNNTTLPPEAGATPAQFKHYQSISSRTVNCIFLNGETTNPLTSFRDGIRSPIRF